MRRRLAIVAAVGLSVGLGAPASGFWKAASGSGSASAAVGTLDAAVIAAPAGATTGVQIDWTTQATIRDAAGAGPVTYVVQRRLASGTWAPLQTGACAGALPRPTQSCIDSPGGSGSYEYRVVASFDTTWTAVSNVAVVQVDARPPPTVSALDRLDSNPTAAGSVRWTVTFSEPVTGVTTDDFRVTAGTGISGGPAVTGVTGSQTTWTVTATTGGGSGTLQLDLRDDDTIVGASGQPLGGPGAGNGDLTGQAYTMDRTAPRVVSADMYDDDVDGRVDKVVVRFDETLATPTITSGWTLGNTPSAGTLQTVATSGAVATLAVREGTGAESTAVGGFTIALAATPNGIRDALDNRSAFAARAPGDLAAPVLIRTGTTDTPGATDGKLEAGDTLTLAFSEPPLASTIPATPSVALSRVATPNAQLALRDLTPTLDLGTPDYLTSTGTAAFSGSTTLTANAVKLTVGNCATSCTLPRAPASTPTIALRPATSITDAAGNKAAGSLSYTGKLF